MTTADQALKQLKEYQTKVNILLETYFQQELKKAQTIDPLAVSAVSSIKKFTLAGGKRIRPAVLYYAYLAAGGKDKKAIKKASLAIELIHSFLLIHDDIMDQDDKRHGIDTIHKKYEKIAKRYFIKKDNEHFGEAMAIVIGDLCHTMANKILFNAEFKPEIVLRALRVLEDIVYEVIPGQMMDIKLGFKGSATEKEILRVQEAKTAYYTFDGPIHLGCILANNNNQRLLNKFRQYSLALGKAFQIQDDILGIFGDEKKLGKPVGSDIIEGKQTLLTNYIFKNGSQEEIKIIKSLLGKKNLKNNDLKKFRNVVIESGALDYSKKIGKKMTDRAIDILEKTDFQDKEAKIFFKGIAEYIMNRNK